jgi:hypothetical protein
MYTRFSGISTSDAYAGAAVCQYNCSVSLGVGVAVNELRLDAVPPNVAMKLATNLSKSSGKT